MSTRQTLTRAEIVRQRRKQESHKRQGQTSQRAQRPLTSVNYRQSGRASSYGRNRKRPRYQVAFSMPGAQVRAPALPSIQFGWRLLSGLLITLALYVLYILATSPEFRMGAAETYGNLRIGPELINNTLGLAGKSAFTAVPARMERDLLIAFPDLANVSVGVTFPARVVVTVTERQPVIAWEQDGHLVWIDAEGIAFPPRGEPIVMTAVLALGAPPALPTTDDQTLSTTPPPFLSTGMVQALQTLAPYVPSGTRLVYHPDYGMGWQDTSGWYVYFGQNTNDIPARLVVYQAIAEQLAREGFQPALIGVEYLHAPYYRLQQ